MDSLNPKRATIEYRGVKFIPMDDEIVETLKEYWLGEVMGQGSLKEAFGQAVQCGRIIPEFERMSNGN